MTSKDYRALAGLAVVWFALIAAVDPRGNFPLNDDWSYSAMLANLMEQHRLLPTDFTSMPLIGQIIWALPFAWLSGSVTAGARLSTLIMGLVGPVALFAVLRRLGATTASSMLAALAVMTNPLWISLSCTFMTDVPFASVAMCAVALLIAWTQSGKTAIGVAAIACLVWATLIRQIGLFFALGAVLLLWPSRPSVGGSARACAPLAACALALLGYSWVLGHSSGVPALYERRNLEALTNLVQPFSHAPVIAMGLLATGLYTAWSLIPIFPLMAARIQRLPDGRRWGVVITTTATLVFVVVLALHKTLPLTGNIVNATGLGAMTLAGADTLPAIPGIVRGAVTLLAIAAGVSAICAIGIDWRTRPRDLFARVAAFTIVTGACYTAAISQLWVFDRYVVPLMLVVIATAVASSGRVRLPRWALAATVVLVAVNATIGVLGIRDYYAWNRARWAALADLERRGVPPGHIDGGDEYNGLSSYDPARPLGTYGWWGREQATYRISFVSKPGWTVAATYPYQTLLPPSHREIVVLTK